MRSKSKKNNLEANTYIYPSFTSALYARPVTLHIYDVRVPVPLSSFNIAKIKIDELPSCSPAWFCRSLLAEAALVRRWVICSASTLVER